jgi:hypothetical protein
LHPLKHGLQRNVRDFENLRRGQWFDVVTLFNIKLLLEEEIELVLAAKPVPNELQSFNSTT